MSKPHITLLALHIAMHVLVYNTLARESTAFELVVLLSTMVVLCSCRHSLRGLKV